MQVEDCNVAVNSTAIFITARVITQLSCSFLNITVVYSITFPWIYVVKFNGDLSF